MASKGNCNVQILTKVYLNYEGSVTTEKGWNHCLWLFERQTSPPLKYLIFYANVFLCCWECSTTNIQILNWILVFVNIVDTKNVIFLLRRFKLVHEVISENQYKKIQMVRRILKKTSLKVHLHVLFTHFPHCVAFWKYLRLFP